MYRQNSQEAQNRFELSWIVLVPEGACSHCVQPSFTIARLPRWNMAIQQWRGRITLGRSQETPFSCYSSVSVSPSQTMCSMKSAPWVMNSWHMLFQKSQWFFALGRLSSYNPCHSPAWLCRCDTLLVNIQELAPTNRMTWNKGVPSDQTYCLSMPAAWSMLISVQETLI